MSEESKENALVKHLGSLSKVELLELALDAIKESEGKRDIAESKVKALSGKAKFADRVLKTDKWVTMQEAAKIINFKGIGQNKLFSFLRAEGVCMNTNRRWNLPYERYVQSGYFKVIEEPFRYPDGEAGLALKTVVSQKGLNFILRKLEENIVDESDTDE